MLYVGLTLLYLNRNGPSKEVQYETVASKYVSHFSVNNVDSVMYYICMPVNISFQICNNRGPANGMEMDVCAAYGHVTTTQSPPTIFGRESI